MKFFLTLLFVIIGLQPVFAIEEWQNFTEPFPIRDAAGTGIGVWLATDGGLRYRDADADYVYSPSKGLEASVFYGVVSTPYGVFAVSEFGLIARLKDDFTGWDVLNRSFLSGKVRVVPGMLEHSGTNLVIAFENKIAFVDMLSGSSILSVDRIGDVSLSVYGPQQIEVRGDSLYVETVRGTLVRKMDWDHLAEDMRLVDPETWTRVKGACVLCRDSMLVMPDGKELKDSLLFYDGKSLVKWRFDYEGITYLVGHNLIVRYEKGKLQDLTKYVPFQLGGAYEVAAMPEGGVVAVSTDGRLSANPGIFWFEPTILFQGFGNQSESYNNRVKALSVLNEDRILYHIWGLGFFMYSEKGYNPYYYIMPWDDTCVDQYIDSCTVAVGTTVAPDRSGFLVATAAQKTNYSVDYISKDGDVSCATGAGSTNHAGPIVARMDENGSDWIAYVSSRENFSAFATGGLDIVRFPSPSKNGGRIVDPKVKSIAGLDGNTPIDMAIDEEREVLWLVSATGIGYMEFDKDSIRKPVSMNGLVGAEFTSIDVDRLGNVWVGTTQQGAYRLSRRGSSFDTLTVSHYTMTEGLLNNTVLDLAVDGAIGVVWFAHENGVSLYQRNDLRKPKDVTADSVEADIKVYPVPFRPRVHSFLKIDNIPEDSRVDIYNRGGSLIRSFVGDGVAGGLVEWDGTGKNGMLVAPGVYYYVVRANSKAKKGKFLVIH